MSNIDLFECKGFVLGDSGVGKTSMLVKYFQNTFSSEQQTTTGVSMFSKELLIDSTRVKIQLWDTAGQEKYRSIAQQQYQIGHGFLLIYSIDDRTSFENLNYWINEIKEKCKIKHYSLVIVGNKCDLDQRKVTKKEGKEFAIKHNCPFFETSSKNGTNVSDSFQALIELCLQNQKMYGTSIESKNIKKLKSDQNPKIEKEKENCC